jgi:hypothetical protein
MAYAGTLSHVVLTASTRFSSYIYSLNKNTVLALVHPNQYLNTVYITSYSFGSAPSRTSGVTQCTQPQYTAALKYLAE